MEKPAQPIEAILESMIDGFLRGMGMLDEARSILITKVSFNPADFQIEFDVSHPDEGHCSVTFETKFKVQNDS